MLTKKTFLMDLFILILAIAIGLAGSYLYSGYKSEKAAAVQQDLAEEVVRFHVLAAGNSQTDQALKLLVKNAVLEYMSEALNKADSPEEALLLLENHRDEIIRVAQKTLRDNGCYDSVDAYIEDVYFPVKTYGDVTFPAGVYTAFRIIIGEGDGNNWWCVLYPPLCFVDITHGILPDDSKEMLKNVLTEDDYAAITNGSFDSSQVSFQFRILTFLN